MRWLTMPIPRPGPDEVVVEPRASTMHIDEIYAAQGTALGRLFGPQEPSKSEPLILGSALSGTIAALGSNVKDLRVGDDVIAIPKSVPEFGGWASYRCLLRSKVRRKPRELNHNHAAALAMAATVGFSVTEKAQVAKGDHCVVVGASGAIGAMVLQFLKSRGCLVTAVCSAKNETLVRELGADHVVDYSQRCFADVASARQQQFDAVFDCVGGRQIEQAAFRVLRATGRFITVVGPVAHIGEQRLPVGGLLRVIAYMLRRILTTRLRSGPRYVFCATNSEAVLDKALAYAIHHGIRMPIDETIPFELNAIKGAVRRLQTHRVAGRIVIEF